MFREPEELAVDEAAAKLDRIAAAGRSTIRRESTTRPRRFSSSRSLIDHILGSRREAALSENNPSRPSREQELDAELGRLRRQRQRARVHQRDREIARRIGTDNLRPEPESRSDVDVDLLSRLRTDFGTATRDELHPEFALDTLLPNTQESISQHLPRPSRESGLRFEVGATSQSNSQHSRPPRMPARRSTPPGSRRARRSYRPSFADPEEEDDEENENDYHSGSESLRPERIPEDGPITSPPPERQDGPYPPLRRVNHFSPRPWENPASRFDGLGDRNRSPGPTNDEPVEENWANLLSTMEPARSSTATSFMSTRSDSRNGSNRSSQATTMTTSFGEIGGDESCDLDLPSGITEDDVREIRARHGRLPRDLDRNLVGTEGVMRQGPPRDISRGNDRTLELELFGVILERMQRREEIPDEWWAAVGLSPDVVRGSA
ncbi:hypothetical protein A1O7_06003 [Cladophialophora yegresii CBS 114405]|uniref:Uncharacterized protein n=1 Tax=Cladophialophora yegresii CBS 114405 TaxID=1182544 RepID=W9W237_9EURO|nr:uncharacterized protein A1O7_06003 [Cladophialophora yegresii CBS 114405]EXJ58576.1 hypothetical protein A1O7_06003 [Cladophialophora yegresii CBS 114405]